jgi:hypothetical protein
VAPGLSLNAALALCPGLGCWRVTSSPSARRWRVWAPGPARSPRSSASCRRHPAAGDSRQPAAVRRPRGAAPAGARRAARHRPPVLEAVAPTPLAAAWLARAADAEAVTDPALLASRIGRLRPAVTDWPGNTLALLRSLGIESLADCLRLPRDGFARRLGRGPLADLDRALGRLPDPRQAFRPPPRYRGELELSAETADTARLARAMSCLCAELEGFLRARQRAVGQLVIRLGHLRHPATELVLGLASPALEAAHFDALFAARLERLALPAPVISIALEAEPGEPSIRRSSACSAIHPARRPACGSSSGCGPGSAGSLCTGCACWTSIARSTPGGSRSRARDMPGASRRRPRVRPMLVAGSPRPLACRDGRPWLTGRCDRERAGAAREPAGGTARDRAGLLDRQDHRRRAAVDFRAEPAWPGPEARASGAGSCTASSDERPGLCGTALPLQLQLPEGRVPSRGTRRARRTSSATRRSRSPTSARSPASCAPGRRRASAASS